VIRQGREGHAPAPEHAPESGSGAGAGAHTRGMLFLKKFHKKIKKLTQFSIENHFSFGGGSTYKVVLPSTSMYLIFFIFVSNKRQRYDSS